MEFFKGVNGLYYLVGLLGAALALEAVVPWRRGVKIDFARWARNASLVFYGTIILSLIPLISGYAGAVTAETRGLGLMNVFAIPMWAQLVITVLALDLVFYGQHRILHKSYFFWRLHRAHHTDAHIDVTTSLRFHPFEAVFRASIEVVIIVLIGLPPEGILLSFGVGVFWNSATHANIAAPLAAERLLAHIFVTPRMHRLHHSTAPEHQYTNFGTAFSMWDRLFGTYCAPDNLRDDEIFGVAGAEAPAYDSFATLALDPLRTPKNHAIPHPARETRSASGDAADAGS